MYLYHEITAICERIWERGNFVQTPNFGTFHHFKAVKASDFLLGLWAHQAFCFTNPTFEAVYSLLSDMVAIKPEV